MSEFVEVKTAELSGAALDWAVAKADGLEPMLFPMGRNKYGVVACSGSASEGDMSVTPCVYSTDWSQGGPLMDKHCKGFGMLQDGTDSRWRSFAYNPDTGMQRMVGGETILIAFCRALVALSLGDTVSVPKELV